MTSREVRSPLHPRPEAGPTSPAPRLGSCRARARRGPPHTPTVLIPHPMLAGHARCCVHADDPRRASSPYIGAAKGEGAERGSRSFDSNRVVVGEDVSCDSFSDETFVDACLSRQASVTPSQSSRSSCVLGRRAALETSPTFSRLPYKVARRIASAIAQVAVPSLSGRLISRPSHKAGRLISGAA